MIGLAKLMFGKKEKDLTEEERKQYWQAKKKLYVTRKPEKHREFQRRYYAKHKEQITAKRKERQREEANSEYKIYKLALEKACEEIVDHVGDCPFSAKNLEMPPEKWCDEHCYDGERNRLMCWDIYLLEQAKKEIGNKDD